METTHTTLAGVPTRLIRTEGDRDLPALLLLHGFSDSADGWRRLQRRLADAGCDTVAVDQPSHGQAGELDPDRDVIPQFVEFAASAAEVADRGRGVIVVGNSLGGAHALLLAQHHPDLVRGVVAISPASFDHPWWFRILDEDAGAAQRVRDRARKASTRRAGPVRRAIADTAIRAVAFGRPWLAPQGFVHTMRQQFGDAEQLEALRDLASRVPGEYFHTDPIDLPSIPHPVLALWGTLDRLVLVSSRATLEAGLADLEFVALPGVGHMPQLEVPGRTTKHVLDFAERVGSAAPAPSR